MALKVAGLTRLSTTDFPGRLAAVVFVHGCPWRCQYCHNPELQPRAETPFMPWQSVLDFLDRRRGLLDGVVFSGGEPTIDAGLGSAIKDVRLRGYKVGLHTAGIYPRRLRALLPAVDWVGFDVKAPFADYARTTGVDGSGAAARLSLDHLLASGVAHEVRTTHHAELLPAATLRSMATALQRKGVREFALQSFRAEGCAGALRDIASSPPGDQLIEELRRLFPVFTLRPAA